MKATKLFKDFFDSGKSGGLILIAFTMLSLTLAKSNFGANKLNFLIDSRTFRFSNSMTNT